MDPKNQEEGRRPTPVRKVMEAEGEEEKGPAPQAHRIIEDSASDGEWVVRVEGRSGGGVLPLRTIPLMELTFSRLEEPDKPLRMATSRGTHLEGFQDQELLVLLRSARPYRSPMKRPSEEERRKKGRLRGRRSGD